MWASERGGSGLTVTEMLDPLVNVTDPMAALFAASALGKWITATEEAGGTVSAQELQYAQDVLAEALSTQTDEQLRIGAVGTLAYSMRDGYTRLDSLRQVLEGGDDPLLRRMAVDGLAGTAGELEAEARAVLQSWVSQETDPKLKQHIEAKLAAASATGEG